MKRAVFIMTAHMKYFNNDARKKIFQQNKNTKDTRKPTDS